MIIAPRSELRPHHRTKIAPVLPEPQLSSPPTTAGVRERPQPIQPREVGFYVPPNPERMMDPRPNRPQVIQSCDCYVDRNGLTYLTDPNAGLNILQFEGELAS